MSKPILSVSVAQLTAGGGYRYPWHAYSRGEATFSKTFNTCYYEGKTFKRIKGGEKGGNYRCVEAGEIYRISQQET